MELIPAGNEEDIFIILCNKILCNKILFNKIFLNKLVLGSGILLNKNIHFTSIGL
jgi:hypothetical protein